MRHKDYVDRAVAIQTRMPLSTVRTVTAAFLDRIATTLVEDSTLELQNFATFKVEIRKRPASKSKRPTKKVYVRFIRKAALTRILNQLVEEEITMEKYGVDESDDQNYKKASDDKKCPKCGTTTEKHGRVIICPKCGTEPFEAQK